MPHHTISLASIPLRPDPDESSPSDLQIAQGDTLTILLTLADWVKVAVARGQAANRHGWIKSAYLVEISARTFKLYREPLSDQADIVIGECELIGELANWRKVKVTLSDGEIRVGWINADEESSATLPDADDDAPSWAEMELRLGPNEEFRDALLKAGEITRIDPAALAALVDAEAAKTPEGKWDQNSKNEGSGAAGLTQFLRSTWLEHARNPRTALNKTAKEKGWITGSNLIVEGREEELLNLRFDPYLSILSAAEFGMRNLEVLQLEGVLPDSIGDDEKARYIYLAHHEGVTGAAKFLWNENSDSFDKLVKQVGRAKASSLVAAAGGDVALAYRTWLNEYMDEKIRPSRFRARGSPSVDTGAGTRALGRFDGPPIPMSLLGGRTDLVIEIQQRLSDLGYVDPPADGRFGPTSNWGLSEFCDAQGVSMAAGFTPDIARTLLNPARPLPDIQRTGSWFDHVLDYMKRKKYWICRHPDCKNVLYVEGLNADGTLNSDAPNVFNDLRVVFHIDPVGRPVWQSWEATTEPGTYWTLKPMNPRGAARIAFNQYKSWVIGTHLAGRASGHEALVQVQPVAVHRDLNKDYKRTNDKIDEGLFGINQHWGYDAPKDDLRNTSAGCLVGRTREGHREFMELLKSDPRYQANHAYRFMTAVLAGDEVIRLA